MLTGKLTRPSRQWVLVALAVGLAAVVALSMSLTSDADAKRGHHKLRHSGTISNTTPINIPAGEPTDSQGPAAPYPSSILVKGFAGSIKSVVVHINGLTHTDPCDLDFVLVGPQGQKVFLMDEASSSSVTGLNLTFSDSGIPVPGCTSGTPLTSTPYQPTGMVGTSFPPPPAPGPPYGSALSVFNGTKANGTWSLYVFDDAGGDFGNISGGWSLDLKTAGGKKHHRHH